MTDLQKLQDEFWTKFCDKYPPGNSKPPAPTRCIKHDRNSTFWLETIVNFGHDNRIDDKNIAVSVVLQEGIDAYEYFKPSAQDELEIEGERAGVLNWTDESVNHRRTIKLTRETPDLASTERNGMNITTGYT